MHVDGSKVRAAADGVFLDADGDGNAAGQASVSFTTVSTTGVFGTSLVGKVVDPGADLQPMTFDDIRRGADGVIHTADDVFLNPIAHAKVYILGQEDRFVFTDANGNFTLSNVPVGEVKVAIDGRTATNAPSGVFWPEMVMAATLRPGTANTLMGSMGSTQEQLANSDRAEVYLPRVATSVLQAVSATAPTVITVEDPAAAPALTEQERDALTLTVQPGSAIGENGQVLTDVKIGMATVPPELVRDMLPPGVLQHTFDITIQAPGVAAFATPVQISGPNVFNAAPGTKLNILSFDHTTGRLVINGTGTVSADGTTVVSDPGSGVVAPGWHGWAAPGTRVNGGVSDAVNQDACDVTGALISGVGFTAGVAGLLIGGGTIAAGPVVAVVAVAATVVSIGAGIANIYRDWNSNTAEKNGEAVGQSALTDIFPTVIDVSTDQSASLAVSATNNSVQLFRAGGLVLGGIGAIFNGWDLGSRIGECISEGQSVMRNTLIQDGSSTTAPPMTEFVEAYLGQGQIAAPLIQEVFQDVFSNIGLPVGKWLAVTSPEGFEFADQRGIRAKASDGGNVTVSFLEVGRRLAPRIDQIRAALGGVIAPIEKISHAAQTQTLAPNSSN